MKFHMFKKYFQNVQLFSINPIKCSNVYAKSYNHGHGIFRHFDHWLNYPFTSSEMKRDYYNKHGIYELPHELPNDLRIRILGN